MEEIEIDSGDVKGIAKDTVLVAGIGLTRVGQCAKVLKCPNFRAFSHSFCLNIYKNGQKHETF